MLKVTVTGGKVTLDEVWRNKQFDNMQDSVMLLDGFLYGTSCDYKGGVFMCVDWKTSEIRWESGKLGQGSSFIWAEGLFYLFSEQGEVMLVRPSPEKFDVISRFDLPEGGEGKHWAHPVVFGKRLYLRHGKFLYCYDVAR
jgi:hypothetical protein